MDHRHDWYDDDRFWELMRPYMFTDRSWERAEKEIDQLVEHHGLEPGDRILDLPCGPGRHALELAQRGFSVTAVDRTESFVDEVDELAAEQDVKIETHTADMREFEHPRSFDVVVNLFTSFGYFDDEAENQGVLARFFEHLRPGGRLVMDVVGKEGLAQTFQPRDWHEFDDGALLLEERELSEDWGWLENRWILFTPDGERHEFRLGHRLYSGVELRRMVEQAGFADVEVKGSLDGEPYAPKSHRLVVTGHKPE